VRSVLEGATAAQQAVGVRAATTARARPAVVCCLRGCCPTARATRCCVRLPQPDEAGALLHYYFGAAGGDAFSQAALGYRHAYGIGVPRSCWSAVAYYKCGARVCVCVCVGVRVCACACVWQGEGVCAACEEAHASLAAVAA
jgi:hypothetical protein